MTAEEKKDLLLKHCPELSTGLTESDLNNYLVTLIHDKIVSEKHLNTIVDKLIVLIQQNEMMQNQLLRIAPLLNATEAAQK